MLHGDGKIQPENIKAMKKKFETVEGRVDTNRQSIAEEMAASREDREAYLKKLKE